MEEGGSKLLAAFGMDEDKKKKKKNREWLQGKGRERELQGDLSFVMKTSQSLNDLPNALQIKVDQILV